MRTLVKAAEQKSIALVVIDPHRDSLAAGLLEHLVARGMKKRILYDRLAALDRVLGWDWVPASDAKNELERWTENEEQVRAFADVLCRRRQLDSLATAPTTEEWVIAALTLYVEQKQHRPLTDLAYVFERTHPTFKGMLDGCRNSDVVRKFRQIEQKEVGRGQFGAAERLIRGVCTSPAFAIRCGATFQLPEFLDNAGILIVEGGGTISDDDARLMMGAVILRTIRYVRTRSRPNPPVILALDEATNAELISSTGYETRAAAELQKSQLSLHVLLQNLNFPSATITEDLLTNCLRHEWFFTANASVAHKAAIDLGDRSFEQQIRELKPGERFVKQRARVYREYVPLLKAKRRRRMEYLAQQPIEPEAAMVFEIFASDLQQVSENFRQSLAAGSAKWAAHSGEEGIREIWDWQKHDGSLRAHAIVEQNGDLTFRLVCQQLTLDGKRLLFRLESVVRELILRRVSETEVGAKLVIRRDERPAHLVEVSVEVCE